MNIRVPPDFRAQLERVAEAEDHSLSNMAYLILRWGVDQYDAAGSWGVLKKSKVEVYAAPARGK